MIDVIQIPVWNDNYAYLITDRETKATAVVDSPEAPPILKACQQNGLKLEAIFNTHHHFDHIGSNEALIKEFPGLRVLGHKSDQGRIPGMTEALEDGQQVRLGNSSAEVIFVPGHTSGHIAYWFKDDAKLFCGDTLFVAGCGRLFEGTPEQMKNSLNRFRSLPEETEIYCAHEYTASNFRFALAVEPGNKQLEEKAKWVFEHEQKGEPTVPSTIKDEKATNPFFRWDQKNLIDSINEKFPGTGTEPVAVFAATRSWKDNF